MDKSDLETSRFGKSSLFDQKWRASDLNTEDVY